MVPPKLFPNRKSQKCFSSIYTWLLIPGDNPNRERTSEHYPLLIIGSDTRLSPSFHTSSLWHFPSVSLVGQKDQEGSQLFCRKVRKHGMDSSGHHVKVTLGLTLITSNSLINKMVTSLRLGGEPREPQASARTQTQIPHKLKKYKLQDPSLCMALPRSCIYLGTGNFLSFFFIFAFNFGCFF